MSSDKILNNSYFNKKWFSWKTDFFVINYILIDFNCHYIKPNFLEVSKKSVAFKIVSLSRLNFITNSVDYSIFIEFISIYFNVWVLFFEESIFVLSKIAFSYIFCKVFLYIITFFVVWIVDLVKRSSIFSIVQTSKFITLSLSDTVFSY